jgi:hypothetical protein
VPGRDHPNEIAKPVFPVPNEKGDESSAGEAHNPLLLGVIVSLVFDIGELE